MRIIVHVKPRAHKNQVIQTGEDTFDVLTTAVPENGKATKAVLDLLAKHLGIGVSRLRVVMGKTAKEKLIEIEE